MRHRLAAPFLTLALLAAVTPAQAQTCVSGSFATYAPASCTLGGFTFNGFSAGYALSTLLGTGVSDAPTQIIPFVDGARVGFRVVGGSVSVAPGVLGASNLEHYQSFAFGFTSAGANAIGSGFRIHDGYVSALSTPSGFANAQLRWSAVAANGPADLNGYYTFFNGSTDTGSPAASSPPPLNALGSWTVDPEGYDATFTAARNSGYADVRTVLKASANSYGSGPTPSASAGVGYAEIWLVSDAVPMTTVPEPATVALLAVGLAMVGAGALRRRRGAGDEG